jgi:hypothetical protein
VAKEREGGGGGGRVRTVELRGREAVGTGLVAVDLGGRRWHCAIRGRGGHAQGAGGLVSWAGIERKKTGRAKEEQCIFDLFKKKIQKGLN